MTNPRDTLDLFSLLCHLGGEVVSCVGWDGISEVGVILGQIRYVYVATAVGINTVLVVSSDRTYSRVPGAMSSVII